MRKAAFIFSLFILSLFFLLSCGEKIKIQKLSVEEGKRFEKFNFKKIGEIIQWGGWCLACPQGIFSFEVLDRQWSEFKFKLYDYSGKLKKEKILAGGEGPNQIKVTNFGYAWLSSSGKILCNDNENYLKSIDPETFEIETLAKFSNVIEGYGSKYIFSRHGATSWEEKGKRAVTSLESNSFYEDMTYYIVIFDGVFENLSVITTAKKERPWTWAELKKRVSYIDYYADLRLKRILSVDWERGMVYYLPDIEKPEIERVDFEGKRKERFLINIDSRKFKFEKEELELWQRYAESESASLPPIIKNFYKTILSIPSHAPALMGIKVRGDWLLIITGNRNWKNEKNEVLVYRLPSLSYEGNFFIPFPNQLKTIWDDNYNYYTTRKLIEKEDGYYLSHEIYFVEEK
jgi:hypothetical protein